MLIKQINWQETLDVGHKVLWPNKPIEFCIVNGDLSVVYYGVFIDDEIIGVAILYKRDSSVSV